MLLGLVLCVLAAADDIVLLYLSKYGLEMLIRLCYQYSCKWRFEYVPVKCSVLVLMRPSLRTIDIKGNGD